MASSSVTSFAILPGASQSPRRRRRRTRATKGQGKNEATFVPVASDGGGCSRDRRGVPGAGHDVRALRLHALAGRPPRLRTRGDATRVRSLAPLRRDTISLVDKDLAELPEDFARARGPHVKTLNLSENRLVCVRERSRPRPRAGGARRGGGRGSPTGFRRPGSLLRPLSRTRAGAHVVLSPSRAPRQVTPGPGPLHAAGDARAGQERAGGPAGLSAAAVGADALVQQEQRGGHGRVPLPRRSSLPWPGACAARVERGDAPPPAPADGGSPPPPPPPPSPASAAPARSFRSRRRVFR